MKQITNSSSGFTLIEMIIAGAVLLALSYSGMTFLKNIQLGARKAEQNAERVEAVELVRSILQIQNQCDLNFGGLNPATSNTITAIKRQLTTGEQDVVTSGGNYGRVHISNITFGGTGANFIVMASADGLNGIANLQMTVERIEPGGAYSGAKIYELPISVRIVPAASTTKTPGTIDFCRYGSTSQTNLFNIDDTFPGTPPPVGTNQSTAYITNNNLVVGQPQDELYNILFRTEGGDIMAKDGNLYISRDGKSCTRRQCSNHMLASDPTCSSDSDCSSGIACVLSDSSCTGGETGNGIIDGAQGDIIVGFGEYGRMYNTFGPGSSYGLRQDQMFIFGWDSGSGNIGVAMPENFMFKIYGTKSGMAGDWTRASLSASGNVYTNHAGTVGGGTPAAIVGETPALGVSLVGFGHLETMLSDASFYGIDQNKVFGVGWSDGGGVPRAGFMLPEGWGMLQSFNDTDANGSIKPGFFLFAGNGQYHGSLTLKKTSTAGTYDCSTSSPGINYGLGEPAVHCGNGDLKLEGDIIPTDGSLNIAGTVTATGTITSSSDQRLKKDVQNLVSEESLEKILTLEGVSYHWKDKKRGTRREIGLIAQNVEKVFPELVRKGENGFLSVAYQNLVAPIIGAVKALFADILKIKDEQKELKNEVAELKKENQELKAALCAESPKLKFCH